VLGIFRKSKSGDMRIEPVDKKTRNELTVSRGDDGGARAGELVAVEVTRDRGRGLANARVTERLGKPGGQHAISIIAVHQHGLPHKFGDDVFAQAEAMGPAPLGGRLDMRSVPLITIDPPDARDHDDAVWAAPDDDPKNPGGFRAIVAIADVGHYVRPGTALDREARERGNSTYFPDRVVPMLPERLSANLCSLRANEDRPALAVTMVFDRNGTKKSHEFSRVLMRSAAKLSYDQAQAAIDGRPDDASGPLLEPVLKPLWAAYRAVAKARDKRAPLELDLPERKILFNDKGEIDRIVVPPRLDCHRLIEEFMIQANVCAAETLEKQRSPLLYRVHESPSDEKVRALSEFLATLGLKLALGQGLKPKAFNQILAKVKGKDVEQLVNDVVLRSQAQAVYSSENRGHFGLNLRRYAHFTSPIRRYADVIVHRSLISALGLGDGGLDDNDVSRLYETAELISAAERRSMLAERDTVDRLVAAHLADKVGAQFNGRIAGVTDAGLFVALAETGANGFVPARAIGAEYFVHDCDRHALVGERSGETYRLGDQVEVSLVEVTPLAGGLRFDILSPGRKGKPPARRERRDRPPIRQRGGHRRRR
ncbi:MAG: ribonuclease R, partial [Hyphomicrobiales bacterium]